MATVADEVLAVFAKKGKTAYYGEAVSQLEHALQAAQCAEQEHASDALIVAALLHDIGHILEDIPEDTADMGIDAKHEEIGQQWLARRFGKNVVEPVYLHVNAKRYLCATDAGYLGKLSPASVQSLALQGGVMTSEEVRSFEQAEFYREAISLRSWDDRAKIPGLTTRTLADYRGIINSVAGA
jgi:phosphonate degradation associated HDIG domain protein